MDQSPSWEAESSQPVKIFPDLYRAWRFITAFRSRPWSVSWARWTQSTTSHSISLRSILILFSQLHQSLLCNFSKHFVLFYDEDLLAHWPTSKLEDYPLRAVRDCLFNVFAGTHLQSQDALCRREQDSMNMGTLLMGCKSALGKTLTHQYCVRQKVRSVL